jgi:phenylalanyl-tRNA synthetase beta chain
MVGREILEPFGLALSNLIEVRNPVGVQNSVLRNSLAPGMVDVLLRNERRGLEGIAVFELGKAYFKDGDDFREIERLCVGLSGLGQGRAWYSEPRLYDFYDLKGILEAFAECLGVRLEFAPNMHQYLHPGRRASISVEANGTEQFIGYLGEVAPPICEAVGSRRRLYLAECDFELLRSASAATRRFTDLDRYPAVKRDIAIIVPEGVADSEVRGAVLSEGGHLVESVEIFDVYEGDQVPEGTKSLAYGIVYRSRERTLTEQEVDSLQKKIEERLIKDFDGRIRTK